MKKSQVVGAVFVAMTIASPAFAADLLKAPAAAPVAVPSWTGWYIGGEVGFKQVKDDWGTDCIQGGASLFDFCPSSQFPGAPDSSANFKTSGLRAGVYAGAMFQVNPSWVLGIEGDYAFYKKSAAVDGIVGCVTAACPGLAGLGIPFTSAFDSTSVTNKDDFSLRLRGGFLVTPDIMVYGTGGVAFQRVEASMTCGTPPPGPGVPAVFSPACGTGALAGGLLSQTDGKWLPGWTVGGGVEWKLASMGLPNWLLRGEYRYSDFGTWKPDFFRGSGVIEVFPSIKVTSQIATAGISYMFPIK
jgi:outer membrane immunogenic protein